MSPRAHITTGIISVFIPHFLVVSISRSLYLESFSDGTAISMSLLVMFSRAYFRYQAYWLLFLYLYVFAYPKVSLQYLLYF